MCSLHRRVDYASSSSARLASVIERLKSVSGEGRSTQDVLKISIYSNYSRKSKLTSMQTIDATRVLDDQRENGRTYTACVCVCVCVCDTGGVCVCVCGRVCQSNSC